MRRELRETSKQDIQIFVRIQSIGLGGFNQAVDDGAGSGPVWTSGEEPVPSSYGERPNAVFSDIVGNLAVAVFQIVHQSGLLI